jgi:hypothetical protein
MRSLFSLIKWRKPWNNTWRAILYGPQEPLHFVWHRVFGLII